MALTQRQQLGAILNQLNWVTHHLAETPGPTSDWMQAELHEAHRRVLLVINEMED